MVGFYHSRHHTTRFIADKLDVSVETIKGDLKYLRENISPDYANSKVNELQELDDMEHRCISRIEQLERSMDSMEGLGESDPLSMIITSKVQEDIRKLMDTRLKIKDQRSKLMGYYIREEQQVSQVYEDNRQINITMVGSNGVEEDKPFKGWMLDSLGKGVSS